jgi:putative ABC transport system ATP-binding protein
MRLPPPPAHDGRVTSSATTTTNTLASRAQGITKSYGRGPTAVRALDDVSVAFPAGGFSAVMGPSGSGKSTLLHCLAGLDSVDRGTIHLGDIDVTALDQRGLTRLRRERIGFIFQAYNLLPALTVEENIELPFAIARRKPDRTWVARVVEGTGLRPRLRHRPGQLSGGQQQRVAAARALAGKPDVVFADEPTGNLDSQSGAELLEFMRFTVDALGQTVIMVTHDTVAASYADGVVFLADGRVVDEMAAPTPERVLDRLKSLGSLVG